ncbi:hypothetical protein CRE_20795 [Caenorhabditis remanei]|uniref:Transmembrane protein n=1 Tax=Caenorhabditis remanei TaxID=31234 RepID=E3MFL1_CAERE|nr:hypothetical protein CRE_20795 [Caenorhabditis remanei]
MAFIDDGSISSYKKMKLAEVGIGIEHGSILQNLTTGYETGAESTLRVLEFYGSDRFIVINFWTRTYYFMKRNDKYMMRSNKPTIKPSFDHFVRIYFICAPGNARSALILFGEQATLRKLKGSDGDSDVTKSAKSKKKTKRRAPIEMEIGNKTVKRCRKNKKNREKRSNKSNEKQVNRDISKAVPNKKDTRRMERRALIFLKVSLVFAHFGFGVAIFINLLALLGFFLYFKRVKPIPVVVKEKGEKEPGKVAATTTDTKTKSDKKDK